MQSRNGNCITELVIEIPRCCSSAIQSLVAWRAALRPFTEPASWIAPPNNSNFSVSVVLPASGCEMIAKVRRRAIASRTSASAGVAWAATTALIAAIRSLDHAAHHNRVLTPVVSLVITATHPDLDESGRLVQADGRMIRRPHFQKDHL